jgi:hypothetical protein
MAIMFDPITTVNLILSLTILVLGVVAYGKKKNGLALYIGGAFGLFGLSHLLTLLGLAQSLTVFFNSHQDLGIPNCHLRVADVMETFDAVTIQIIVFDCQTKGW